MMMNGVERRTRLWRQGAFVHRAADVDRFVERPLAIGVDGRHADHVRTLISQFQASAPRVGARVHRPAVAAVHAMTYDQGRDVRR
jgi:hypothetical protein